MNNDNKTLSYPFRHETPKGSSTKIVNLEFPPSIQKRTRCDLQVPLPMPSLCDQEELFLPMLRDEDLERPRKRLRPRSSRKSNSYALCNSSRRSPFHICEKAATEITIKSKTTSLVMLEMDKDSNSISNRNTKNASINVQQIRKLKIGRLEKRLPAYHLIRYDTMIEKKNARRNLIPSC